ncbi:hypothetical protein ABH935_009960 [Catenulispora sp. GAS73]|uniref:hypothetical protein n=1 Tax=Catenulispora sp. GAS73 TaxID=3156269 RepID=UPI003515EF1E
MNFDETLAKALHRAADRVAVNASPVAETVQRGLVARRRRNRRHVTTAVALVAVGAVVVPGVALISRPATTGQRPPASSTSVSSASTPGIGVRTVAVGQRTDTPTGAVLWLNTGGLSLVTSRETADRPDTVQVPHDTNSAVVISRAVGSTTLWAGIYHGSRTPVVITVDIGGRRLTASVLTLTGSPGWVAFTAEGVNQSFNSKSLDSEIPKVSVYAADGTYG